LIKATSDGLDANSISADGLDGSNKLQRNVKVAAGDIDVYG